MGLGLFVGKIVLFSFENWIVSWEVYLVFGGMASLLNSYLSQKYMLESVRFLIVKKDFERAYGNLMRMAMVNERFSPSFVLKEEKETQAMDLHIARIINIHSIDSLPNCHTVFAIFTYQSLNRKSYLWFLVLLNTFISYQTV